MKMSVNIGSLSRRRIVTGVYLFGTGVHVDKRIAPSANFVSSKTPARPTDRQTDSSVKVVCSAVAGPIFASLFSNSSAN